MASSSSRRGALAACGLWVMAGCGDVRFEDDDGAGAGGDAATAVSTSDGPSTASTSKATSTSAVTTGTTTGGGIEILQTGTTEDLHAVLWDAADPGAVIAGGDGATVVRLRPGAAPVGMTQGLVGGAALRITSLAQEGVTLYAGAFDGEGDRQFGHVLRFDEAWSVAWLPQISCINAPEIVSHLGSIVGTCSYYPWLGAIRPDGAVDEALDGFAHVTSLNWAKWAEIVGSDFDKVYALDSFTLERTSTWYGTPGVRITGLLQDHREEPLALTENGDVLRLGPKGTSEVIHPGDGNALHAGTRVDQATTVVVGDAGTVLVMRGGGAFERVDVGTSSALHAVDDFYGHGQVAIVGDGGLAFVLTVPSDP